MRVSARIGSTMKRSPPNQMPISTIAMSNPNPPTLTKSSRLTRRRMSLSSKPTTSRAPVPGSVTKANTRRTPSRLSPVKTPSGDASIARIIGWSANGRPTQLSRLGCRASSVPLPSTIITTASNDIASERATSVNQLNASGPVTTTSMEPRGPRCGSAVNRVGPTRWPT